MYSGQTKGRSYESQGFCSADFRRCFKYVFWLNLVSYSFNTKQGIVEYNVVL